MTRPYALLALWSFAAGAGIPLIGVLNSGLARAVGNPFAATAVMFVVAFAAAAGLALGLYGAPTWAGFAAAPAYSYAAGLFIGFYALSATIIIPRFGAGNFIAFILVAQLVTAALLDQFGWLGLPRRPLDGLRLAGLALLVAGLAVAQWSTMRRAA